MQEMFREAMPGTKIAIGILEHLLNSFSDKKRMKECSRPTANRPAVKCQDPELEILLFQNVKRQQETKPVSQNRKYQLKQ
ncbi:hypothetical protein KKC1_16340 [Calderihabitans maritimus]|uniref:Uncharacterized protein n=2 Tax=Calderihabitans maritimus TaxID=1246530 RepID=A0A1Z5HT84_9FIRM|nr:hypothetical protein KKC1_16340 [Calderihabitans maritimus]